ncbi:Small-conductance mechanosensitive channel [Epibacterium ulvae]|uniref:Small-conductance mechanosensitive channel n=1 Tax=Epibacterium ulvae TaxID=1156985 RepID=A0A1G5QA35_9RHOB|nr:Small-conductance mechanosensitive channel [Epibacterium ulvae]
MIFICRTLQTFCVGLVVLTSLCFLNASPIHAQVVTVPGAAAEAPLTDAQVFYQSWLKTAQRAEGVIDANRASTAALEQLREDLVEFRDRFREAQTENQSRIETLEAQVAALGNAPEEGVDEPQDLAELRRRLTTRLANLRVPRIIAEEAALRANGLVIEVDDIIRERRKTVLLERGPVPINPENWPSAITALQDGINAVLGEVKGQLSSSAVRRNIGATWPSLAISLVIALILLVGGRKLAVKGASYFRNKHWKGTGVWSFVASLLQVFLPYAGIVVITFVIDVSDLLGVRGTLLLLEVPGWALTLLAFRWLSKQLFLSGASSALLPVDPENALKSRSLLDVLALLLVLKDVLGAFEHTTSFSDGALAVLRFPLIVIAALVLLQLRRIGEGQRARDNRDESVSETEAGRTLAAGAGFILNFVRRGAYLLGFVSPILASLGFMAAAEAMIYPAIQTLALIAAFLVLHRFLIDFYGLISGKGAEAKETLGAVLIGFLLSFAAMPLLARVWGVRDADLFDLWRKLLNGFEIGDTRISPTAFITFAVVFFIGYSATRFIQGSLRSSLLPKTKIDPGGQNAIVSGTGYVGIFLAALVAISSAGLDLSSLAIVAGALSVGIGFGLQTIVSNFVSGIILLIERPISKGDWIEVGGMMGYVRDISVRSTRIETFDRTDVIVPNSDLITGTVTNFTRGNTVGRVIVPVGVAYGTDPRRVEAILQEIAQSHPMVLANPAPSVVFQGFGADSLDFEIRAILRDVNWMLTVKSELNYKIAERFTQEQIEIPFAQRDLWIRNPEVLRADDPNSVKR